MAKSAYEEGYEAAAIPPPQQPECPYPEGDPRHDQWWEGYSDWADDREWADRWDAEHA